MFILPWQQNNPIIRMSLVMEKTAQGRKHFPCTYEDMRFIHSTHTQKNLGVVAHGCKLWGGDCQILGACLPSSLTYMTSFKQVRDPNLKNNIDNIWGLPCYQSYPGLHVQAQTFVLLVFRHSLSLMYHFSQLWHVHTCAHWHQYRYELSTYTHGQNEVFIDSKYYHIIETYFG